MSLCTGFGYEPEQVGPPPLYFHKLSRFSSARVVTVNGTGVCVCVPVHACVYTHASGPCKICRPVDMYVGLQSS